MSRLDSMLRRLAAQRDGLNWAAQVIAPLPGDVLEMGLGNGRTYDHLREQLPERRIYVIDRLLQCHPDCIPPQEDFLQGDAQPVLAQLAAQGSQFALVHYDFGIGVAQQDLAEAAALAPLISRVTRKGGLVVSSQPFPGFETLAGPEGIPNNRYHFYRAR